LDDDQKLLSLKNPIKKTKNNVKAILNNQHKAMLTQIIDDSNDYYTTSILFILYMKKKSHESATNLYQMLMIQDLPLDNLEKDLDLLCFPDLYLFGINEQC